MGPKTARPSARRRLLLLLALAIALAAVPGLLVLPGAFAQEAGPEGPLLPEPIADITGAVIPPLPVEPVTLHVDGTGYDRVIAPVGTEQLPFPTISWAVAQAQQWRKGGFPVRIVVAPGTYRETVTIGAAGQDPSLVVESEVPGEAHVSGADVEERWTPVEGTPYLSAPWDQTWGLTPLPSSWDGVDVPDGVRRRELVLVDGSPLVQVLTEAELTPGSFYVDEANGRIVMHPDGDLADRIVEVARRARTLHIRNQARNVTVRGFTFEAAATPFDDHMAYVSDATNVLIEDNTFRHSSWGGLGVCCTAGVTIRGNRAVDNGGNGIDTFETSNAVIEGNTMTGNNQRGAQNGYAGWSVAGSKNLHLHDALFRGNDYSANWSRGLWLDTDVTNVYVVGDRSCGNFLEGLFIEAVQGPLVVEDSTFCGNGRGGIFVGTSRDVTIQRTTLRDNRYGQLVFAGERQRTWTDHVTQEAITVGDFEGFRLVDDVFASATSVPLILSPNIPLADWRAHLAAGEIVAASNTWEHPDLDRAIQIGAAYFSLAEWADLTGETSAAPTTTTTTVDGGHGRPGGSAPPRDRRGPR